MEILWLAAFADVPASELAEVVAFWEAVTRTRAGTAQGRHGQFVPLAGTGESPHLWIQRVERPAGAVSWHPDLYVDDLEEAAIRAADLGAQTTRSVPNLVTLSSPAGQQFCLVSADLSADGPYLRAQPRVWPDGQRSLLDQLSLDIPIAAFASETRFWSLLTGWEQHSGSLAEFDYLQRPPHIPLRLLLQRLGVEDDDGVDDLEPPHAHVDFACDDFEEERRRHERLGATTIRTTKYWVTLRDPVGLLYCITSRNPEES
ncbi:hypothetical protein SAMN05892883_3998 [Jatrophihabitans sp. GAS493]|uniref:VOC family protein n=1 Tax=Jatrophihabitans sp. GAS493 TaxID=1907575 RepID=UPI000BB69719|nr:VOC family protein [Jatrophihabitans sp. GAS493]SOD74806.1 hypothetical protein SAMN05892883_3998 [Jatrophihabitans sp. GAS493]